MWSNGKDTGYKHGSPQNWWFDELDPDCYRYADLDKDYPAEYFPLAEPPRVKEFCDIVMGEFTAFTLRPLKSIIEFGSGGGWYLKRWQDLQMNVQGIEGSRHGVAECLKRGVLEFNIYRHDLQKPFERNFQKADLAICTEVAEHVPLPFHATLVKSLTDHSDVIWFSSEGPEVDNQPHLHHVAEMPQKYWEALFLFFGYACHMLPEVVHLSTEFRGRCLFYRKDV